jgi:hypothetical protein
MASIETSHNENVDTLLSILKDIRDLLRQQERRIQRLEDDRAPTLAGSLSNLSKAEKAKKLDGQHPTSENGSEIGESSQQAVNPTHVILAHPSPHVDEVAPTSLPELSRPESNLVLQETTSSNAEPQASPVCE